jgi:hypothetical protein
MKWESGAACDKRLIADDGEILDYVEFDYRGGYRVRSTMKTYVSEEAAKRAAERKHAEAMP